MKQEIDSILEIDKIENDKLYCIWEDKVTLEFERKYPKEEILFVSEKSLSTVKNPVYENSYINFICKLEKEYTSYDREELKKVRKILHKNINYKSIDLDVQLYERRLKLYSNISKLAFKGTSWTKTLEYILDGLSDKSRKAVASYLCKK